MTDILTALQYYHFWLLPHFPATPNFLSVLFTNSSVMRYTAFQAPKAPIRSVHLEHPLVSISTRISATFMKICQANPDLVETGQKFWAHYVKTEVVFIVSGHIKLP
jgi:hypothetical protein